MQEDPDNIIGIPDLNTKHRFLQKISGLVHVPVKQNRKSNKKLLSRHSSSRFSKLKPTTIGQRNFLRPIFDQRISNMLSQIMFHHPYVLIEFLHRPNQELRYNANINEIIAPFNLYMNNGTCTSRMLIPLLANIYNMTPENFLIYFKGKQVNAEIIRESWKKLFKNSTPEEVDKELKVFFERLIADYPTKDWELNSLDDLYALHVLACAMNTQIYLIYLRIPNVNSTSYTLCVGTETSKYHIYVGVQSKNTFFIAEPQQKIQHIAKKGNSANEDKKEKQSYKFHL